MLVGDTLSVGKHYSGESTLDCSVNHGQALNNVLDTLATPQALGKLFEGKGLAGVGKLATGLEPPENEDWTAEDLASVVKEAKGLSNGNNTAGAVAAILEERLPKFFYFSDYQALPGRIDISELQGTDVPGETGIQTARALLKLASTDAASLTEEEFEDRKAELEAVSNELTEEVRAFWKQNTDLSVGIDLDKKTVPNGYNGQTAVAQYLDVRVRDARHGCTNNFDQRSSGFKWFFSFPQNSRRRG